MCSSPTVRSPWGTTSSSWDHWKRMVAVMCQQCWVSRQLYRSKLTTLLAPPSIPHWFPHQGKGEDLQSQMGTPWSRSWRTLLESRRRIKSTYNLFTANSETQWVDEKKKTLVLYFTRTSGRSAPIVLVPAFDQDKLNVVWLTLKCVTNIEVCD